MNEIMTYKELLLQEGQTRKDDDWHSKLYLVIKWDKEEELFNYKLNSLLVKEGRIYSWGQYEGDDPDCVPPTGAGESANSVMQEDFFDELFLEIPPENPLFKVINDFLEKETEKSGGI